APESLPSSARQRFFEQLHKVYQSGQTYQAQGVKVQFRRGELPEETRYLTFVCAPLYGDDSAITGIFCEGFDVTDSYSAQRRSRALVRLGELIRDIEDPDELAYAA